MDLTELNRSTLTKQEEALISRLISSGLHYYYVKELNSFERKFYDYLCGKGNRPTTNLGVAWVKYARSLPDYRRLFFTSIYSYDYTGHDSNGFREGKHWLTNEEYDDEGFNNNGFDINGLDKNGRDKNGFDVNGYDNRGFKRDGYNDNGIDKQGYDRDGFKDGFDRKGFNRDGYNTNGFNKSGIHLATETKYNQAGYDINGYDKNGFNASGRDRDGKDKFGKKPITFCTCGGGMPNCSKCGGRGYFD
jgi:hypothetical protein